MKSAAEEVKSTRSDARAFADAFAAADDAFTFGPDAGESRTLTLAELGDVIALDNPVARLAAPRAKRPAPAVQDDDALLTLAELGDALARPVDREADELDFDFGTSAHERARRRTAARLHAAPSARRRPSGPARPARREDAERRRRRDDTSPDGRAAMADASASAAELLAGPRRSTRFVRAADGSTRLDAAQALPAELRPSADFLADPDGRRTIEITGQPDAAPVARLREVQRDRAPRTVAANRFRANPDRIAMWAVLLGILLVLIAVTSGSAGAVALPVLSL